MVGKWLRGGVEWWVAIAAELVPGRMKGLAFTGAVAMVRATHS